MAKGKLTPKQAKFIEEFLVDLNATQAAIRAGYSKETAKQIASENLTKPDVQDALQKHFKRRQEKFEITEERIVKELAAIAFGHIGLVAEWGEEYMNAIPKEHMDVEAMKYLDSVEKITIGEDVEKVVVKTLANQKVKSLQLLGEHLGMWGGVRGASQEDDPLKDALSELDEEERPVT